MKALIRFALLLSITGFPTLKASDPEAEIKAVLAIQTDAWNRGDIPTFMTTYASDCIFVGKEIAHGRDQLQARYQKTYPTQEAMGHLVFSGVEVHLLSPESAFVTGEWHLERTDTGGKPIGGLFSLVLQQQAAGWKIRLDHTS
jgi:uncharacterized protein (TIGR02246 family)